MIESAKESVDHPLTIGHLADEHSVWVVREALEEALSELIETENPAGIASVYESVERLLKDDPRFRLTIAAWNLREGIDSMIRLAGWESVFTGDNKKYVFIDRTQELLDLTAVHIPRVIQRQAQEEQQSRERPIRLRHGTIKRFGQFRSISWKILAEIKNTFFSQTGRN